MTLLVDKKKFGFQAIAVVAGIDTRGKVISITMRDKLICTPDFLTYFIELRKYLRRKKTYIFLENLSFNHSHVVANCARRNRQKFIFNAAC